GPGRRLAAPTWPSLSRSPRLMASGRPRTWLSSRTFPRGGPGCEVEAAAADEHCEAAADDGEAEPRAGGGGKANPEKAAEAGGSVRKGGRGAPRARALRSGASLCRARARA